LLDRPLADHQVVSRQTVKPIVNLYHRDRTIVPMTVARKLIAAQGERDAQKVLSEGLTDEVLKLRAIEAFLKLASSPNTKVIITDTDATPLLPMSETK
ncbi:MAG: hypothetical protein AAFX99_30640, partial [Myxococcota bacterium]